MQTTEPASAGLKLTRKAERYLAKHEVGHAKLSKRAAAAIAEIRTATTAEIDRLMAILDRLDGDPDLEDGGDFEDGADAEPTLGWPAGNGRLEGSQEDGEAEPSLGWTGVINQASRNRLGDGEDYEKDDADKEDSDPGEDDGTAESEPDDESESDLGQPAGRNTQHGVNNVSPIDNVSLGLIGADRAANLPLYFDHREGERPTRPSIEGRSSRGNRRA